MLTPHGRGEEQLPRLRNAIARLERLIWAGPAAPVRIEATEPSRDMIPLHEAQGRPLAPLPPPPAYWGMMFDQRWCRVTLPRPAEAGDWLAWHAQGETTVYADGVALGGTDASRAHTRIPAGARELWVEWLAENVGIWTPRGEELDRYGCRFDSAALVRRNDAAWRAHTDLAALAEVLEIQRRSVDDRPGPSIPWGARPSLDRATPLFRAILDGVNHAVDAFDAHGPEAAARAIDALTQRLRGTGDPFFEAILTGHAHIDLVWRWPRRVGEFKAVHTFANALGLMDLDPAFTFGYSQPASYEAIAHRAPEVMSRVRARIAEGRWEPAGMLYVESDTQLPCGEALARSFLLGQRGFENLTGTPSATLWLPDAFGFSGCLPQLVREAGGRSFFSTKPNWSTTTRFPHSAFIWRGSDGSEIVGFIPGDFDYCGDASPHRLHQAAIQQRQAAVAPASLLPTGIGDGGGGATEEMCRRAAVLADLAGLPRTRWGRIDRFFDRLHAVRDRLPVWAGEIYLEYHRGVQTTGREIKQAFRAAERALQTWEASAIVAAAGPIDAAAWQRLVFAQFHDDIPGSSCYEVYTEHLPQMRDLTARAHAAAEHLLTAPGEPCLFNPLPIARAALHEGRLVDLPPLAGVAIGPNARPAPAARASARELTSNRVRAAITADGLLESLSIDGHAIRLARPTAEVVAFAERPHAFEAWDIDRASLDNPLAGHPAEDIRIERATGPDVEIVVERRLAAVGRLTTRYRLVAGEPALRIAYEIDLPESERLVKAAFATGYAAQHARYGAPFGSALRSQRPGRPIDDAAFEVPASRWATIGDEGERDGLAIITESSYGFGAQLGLMHVSLLRTAMVTDVGLDPRLRRDDAGPRYFDMQPRRIDLALARAGDIAFHEHAAVLADTLFTPPLAYTGAARAAGLRGLTATPGLAPHWAKPATRSADAWVLRAHETLGRPGQISLDLFPGWTAARVDLREQPEPAADPFAVRPYAFASWLIERA